MWDLGFFRKIARGIRRTANVARQVGRGVGQVARVVVPRPLSIGKIARIVERLLSPDEKPAQEK